MVLLVSTIVTIVGYNNKKETFSQNFEDNIVQQLESEYGELTQKEVKKPDPSIHNPLTDINPRRSFINSSDDEVAYIDHEGNIEGIGNLTFTDSSEGYGFFRYLGDSVTRITIGWFNNIDVSSTANASEFYQGGNLVIDTSQSSLYNQTDLALSINTTANIQNLLNDTGIYETYNATYDSMQSGQWGTDGTNIYNLTAYIGIGTASPTHTLNVVGHTNLSGNLYAGNSSVFVNSTSGNVGIGTAFPIGLLNIKGTGLLLNITAGSGKNLFFNGTNLGVGTSTPTAKLELYEETASNGLLKIHNAPSSGSCPANMSYINKNSGFCIDNYEAIAMNADGTWNETSDDSGWVATYTDNLLTAGGYAGSASGHYPWVYINQTEARTACANAGKHLCTSVEWLGAVNLKGTVYSLPEIPTDCVVSMNCILGNNLGPNGGDACYGGAMTDCVSSEGVYDMIGNVWEWTNETIDSVVSPSGGAGWHYINMTDMSYSISSVDDDGTYGKDGTYFSSGTQINKAVRRGGNWYDGADAGAFCSRLNNDPTTTSYVIGFRCCSVPN